MAQPLYVWTERYRPKTLSECILPAAVTSMCQKYIEDQEIPNLLLVGPAGIGKTTLAKALCHDISAEFLMVNASEEGRMDNLRTTIRNFASTVTVGDAPRKYVILDEADGITAPAQQAFRSFFEEFAHNCGFILTANFPNRLLPAIRSRCTEVTFEVPAAEQGAFKRQLLTRLQRILATEQVTCDPEILKAIAKKYYPDLRQMIGALGSHVVDGQISISVLSLNDVPFDGLLSAMRAKKFAAVRTWIGEHASQDVGPIRVTASSRSEVLRKLEEEIRYWLEMCPCTGQAYRNLELELIEDETDRHED